MSVETSVKFSTDAARFGPVSINPAWILDGTPETRVEHLSSSADGTASTYIWDCTAGRFNWYYSFDETLHILEGGFTLKLPSGQVREIGVGDTIFFPAGAVAEWTVHRYVRKLAFCRTPLPGFLVRARNIARKVKALIKGAPEEKTSLL